MALLKCRACGKQDAVVTTRGKLEKLTSQPLGAYGMVALTPAIITGIIALIETVFRLVFPWFVKNNEKFVVCKACGHYEKLE